MQPKLIALAYLFFYINCFGQQYPFVHYTPKDGLVNNRVKKAYQDSKGRMYFLTFGGLSVFDGVRFMNYTTKNGLPNNVVNDVLEIGKDSILVATNSANLNLLVRGKIELLNTGIKDCPVINQFYRHNDKRIYLSSDNGLFLFEKNTIRPLNISGAFGRETKFSYLGNIAGNDNFLVTTTNEMRFHNGMYVYDIKNDSICDTKDISGYLLGKDAKNRIWISTAKQLWIVDNDTLKKGKLFLIAPNNGYEQSKKYSTINVSFGNNVIWTVHRNEELRNTEIRRISENGSVFTMPLPEQVTISYIKNIFIDRENNIWLSNDGEGVFKIINSPLQILENPLGRLEGSQVSNAFYSHEITWFNTNTGKLFRKSPVGMKEFSCNLNSSPVIFHEKKNKIMAYDSRNIYEADFEEEKKNIVFRKIISLPDNDFFGKKLVVDENGTIISSQNSGVTAWINKKPVYHIPIEKNESVEDLYFDKNNKLWIVKRFLETAVFELHPESPLQYLKPLFHFDKSQIRGSPRCFLIDKTGIIWIGTREHGLSGYQQQDNNLIELYHFHSGNGLADNFVTTLGCDSLNNILVGTQAGLDRLIRNAENTFQIENLSKSSNFFAYISEIWADAKQAYALTYTGVILQVSQFSTDKTHTTPSLLLEEMRINAKPLLNLKNKFSYKENNLSFLVAAPSFIDERQVAFSYFLQGSGNIQWSDTSSANSVINLTNLSSGKYLLKVKAFFPSTSYAATEFLYSFEITPPWWQTWWLRSIAGLAILGILVLGFRFYYKRRLEKQMVILEKHQAIEKERTRIATDMHDDLGAGLSRIKFLSETIGIKKQRQQPIEEEISKIREYSHEMIDKMGEIVWALNEKNDSLSDLLAYTRVYAMEYLSQNGIKCIVEAPEYFPSNFVNGEFRRNVYLTVKEALHNVVKHAQASSAIIKMQTNSKLEISIQDNGIGFDINKIRSFSNGLTNMKNRITELKGTFNIKNENGTIIKITIPLQI